MAEPEPVQSACKVGDIWKLGGRRYLIGDVLPDGRVFYTVLGERSEGTGSAAWITSGERVA